MTHKKICIPRENANQIMRALGILKNTIEFEDLTKDDIEAKINFREIIKRCDEIKKKIYDYNKICYEFGFPFENYQSFEAFLQDSREDMQNRDKKSGSTYFDLLENEIMENDRKINELVDSHFQIREDLISLVEKKHVFLKFQELVKNNMSFSMTNINFIIGVIPIENEMKMKRMIFRISRGRAVTAFYSLDINKEEYLITSTVRQRKTNLNENKNDRLQRLSALIQSKEVETFNTKKKIFSIIFTGSEENILLSKLLKVCEIFQGSRYTIPKPTEVGEKLLEIQKEIKDKKSLIISIENNLKYFINETNALGDKGPYKYSLYKLFFEQEKMIYTTLNKCIIRDTFIDGRVWIPKKEVGKVNSILQNLFGAQENKATAYLEDIQFEENPKPPTFIEINEFTNAFQMVVDIYGIPRYREINPGYFTIITFPFLFGVMFGDIGHGLILFLFAIYLCLYNDKLSKSKSLLKKVTFSRYFLLLMGFFALYCGFLYNDFLSIPFYFKTCYEINKKLDKDDYVKKKENCDYKFGLDPAWYLASNELAFMNSLKMKLSVILGVFQMAIGIILKGLNALFEKDFVEFFFIFFPQIILMLSLFGYMDFLIFAKWATKYETIQIEINNKKVDFSFTYFAPDIKTYLMNIFLNLGNLPEISSPKIDGNIEIPYEKINNVTDWMLVAERPIMEKIHLGILCGTIFCIIIMFFPKIFINYSKAKKKYRMLEKGQKLMNDNNGEEIREPLMDQKNEVEEPAFSNLFVECSIETIEFILGTVSNTASYLRLWALSLAHSQLAVVFFSKTVGNFGNFTDYWYINGGLLLIIFPIFAGATAIVLLFMDVMECFLHTLRLHWVEFQNKFYKADGYKFNPFYFPQNITLSEEEFKEENNQ